MFIVEAVTSLPTRQPDISARPEAGLPQAPRRDKSPAIIAHFKDASQSKTAFMHLFWQTSGPTPLSPTPLSRLLTFPPPSPSSSFPTGPPACLDERLREEKVCGGAEFGGGQVQVQFGLALTDVDTEFTEISSRA